MNFSRVTIKLKASEEHCEGTVYYKPVNLMV